MESRRLRKRPLTIRDILAWADAYRETMGKWPKRDAGSIVGAKFETWYGVDRALRSGCRGVAGGSSLARLLAEERGARNHMRLAPLTEGKILEWADEHYKRMGSWPKATSGKIPGTDGEKWRGIQDYLTHGLRGLAGVPPWRSCWRGGGEHAIEATLRV
jgi:hypothetical protein